MPPLIPTERVTLRSAPKNLATFEGRSGEVSSTENGKNLSFATVVFDPVTPGGVASVVRDIPQSYLVREVKKQARRGVLNLHAPTDTRTEEQKADEAKTWLQSLGYEVLEVGQTRSAAVCYACLSDAQKETKATNTMPRRVGPSLCQVHHRPVYSMDTGSTAGVSDWQIRHPARWQTWAVLLVEWKRDGKAKRRIEQVRLSDAGWYPIVSSIRDLAEALYLFEDRNLQIKQEPELWAKFRTESLEAQP